MNIVKHIPNGITALNLLSGCMSILFALQGNLVWAGYCIFFAAIFDFFDGFAARLLKAQSPIGLQLDSLCDVVSFGVAPSVMLYASLGIVPFTNNLLSLFPFLIAIFSALRLAKFNIDTRQTESFIGMPTPACAIFIASALIHFSLNSDSFSLPIWPVAAVSAVLSLLLVSEIPMFSLKLKKVKKGESILKKYGVQILFVALSLISIVIFKFGGAAISIILYLILSVASYLFKKKTV